jgi:hypothetical protein
VNYVTIVNEALRESGITLDSLNTGGSDFVSPPDPMYTKFKGWAAQAWEDIQLLKRDWEFMHSSAVKFVRPRIEVYAAYESTNTIANYDSAVFRMHNTSNADAITLTTYNGSNTNFSAITLSGGSLGGATAGTGEGVITISSYNTTVQFEPGDLFVKADSTASFRFKRWATYPLTQTATQQTMDGFSDVAEIKRDSFRVSNSSLDSESSYVSTSWDRLYYVSYSDWLRYGYDRPTNVSKPRYFTEYANGEITFWPPLDGPYHVLFEYTKTPHTLSAYNDEPTGLPSRYHKAIVWLTVMYWAEYDGHAQQYARAKSRYERILNDMCRDLLPPIKVTYDARNW